MSRGCAPVAFAATPRRSICASCAASTTKPQPKASSLRAIPLPPSTRVSTRPRAVSLADISRIKALNLAAHTPLAFARDMFLFSFYMRGMSFVDMAFLRKKDLNNNYVVYSRKKTGQQLTVRWERPMQAIVDAYGPSSTQYLLPVIVREDGTERSQYLNAMLRVNRNLKKIGVMAGIPIPLTMYVARHSWATAAKEKDISIGIISQAMGHDSENTTQIYLASIKTGKIDDANRDILNGI